MTSKLLHMRLIYSNRPRKEFFSFFSSLPPSNILSSSSGVVALLLLLFVFSGIFGKALGSLGDYGAALSLPHQFSNLTTALQDGT
jgi:hypothetical protein